MSTYKAIQIKQTGGVEVLNYTSLPKPTPSPDQVLIKNEFIGVNYIDLAIRAGDFPANLPSILGVEGAGVVDTIGSEAQGLSVGDRVAYIAFGSYGEYGLVERKNVVKIPDSVSFKAAATIILQGLTAITMVQESYKIKKGDTVLVYAAAGGTGQQLVRLASHFGATVIGTISSVEKAEIAREAGATHIINYKEEDITKRVLELTQGKGVHAIFDGVGKTTFDIDLAVIKKLGTIISFGETSGPVDPLNIVRLAAKNARLMRTSVFAFIENQEDFEYWASQFFKLYDQGTIPEEVYKVYSLSNAKQAHLDLEGGKTTGKLLLTPNF